jgi:hypothetical protein
MDMSIPWRAALLVVAAAFIVFLLAKLLPIRIRRATSAELVAARARVREAKTDRDRAEALCAAADAALSAPFGSTRAAAYFMRAMRADPAWPDAVTRAAAALAGRRSRVLRRMMWRRLAATPWDAEHGPVLRAIASAIVVASKGARSSSPQTIVIERVLAGEPLRLEPRA